MYPEHKKHLRRTTALIHNDYNQDMERHNRVSRSRNGARWTGCSESALENSAEDRQRKMSSRKIISGKRTKGENRSPSKTNRKQEDRKRKDKKNHKDFNMQVKKKLKEKVYDPFSTSEDMEIQENSNPWSFGGNSLLVGHPQETVNTAIVDIYDTDDNLETFLKIRVKFFTNG